VAIPAPTDIANCALWLRARDHASLGSPSDGGTPTGWADLSGNAFNQSVGGAPTYQANGGIPYVSLDGVDDYFFRNADLGMYAAAGCSIFVAVRGNPGTDRRLVASGNSVSNAPIYGIMASDSITATTGAGFIRNDANVNVLATGGGTRAFQTFAFNNTDRVYGVVERDGGGGLFSITPWLGGVEGVAQTYTRSGALTLDRFALGSLLRAGAVSFFAGRVYELAIYARAIDDAEATDLSSYLANAFLPDSISTPKRRAQPLIWSPSGPSVPVLAAPTPFIPVGSGNLGGVARVVNVGGAVATFTTGIGGGITNTQAIPVPTGTDLFIAYGPQDTHVVASAPDLLVITPGIGRT
jgi:hypothetical protein